MYSTNFTVDNKKVCLSLHYHGDNSYFFFNGKEIIKLKAKDSEIVPYPQCLGKSSKPFGIGYMLNTGLVGYIYDFSVDYWAIANNKILDVHNYLMKKKQYCIKYLDLLKKIVVVSMTFLVLNVNSFECVSIKNQEYKIRPEIINVNNNEPALYPVSIKVHKCSGSCNNINNPYARFCVSDVLKNMNLKEFNLMSWSNQTKHIKLHETCKYKCRLNSSVCSNKQKWNENRCRYDCKKELIDR